MVTTKDNKPVVVEVFADNGAHSHWTLIDPNNGKILWEELEAPSPSLTEEEVEKMAIAELQKIRFPNSQTFVSGFIAGYKASQSKQEVK